MLSARKEDKKGHPIVSVCTAPPTIAVGVRFRRRGESQASNLEKLLNTLSEDRGEMSMHGMIVTVDMGEGALD